MKEKFAKFSAGRNGLDVWNCILAVLTLVFIFVSLIKENFIFLIFAVITLIIFIVRALSRNLDKRNKENEVWVYAGKSIRKETVLAKNRWNDRGTHVYKKCPKCKNVLRMKRHKGDKEVTCPYCANHFVVTIRIPSEEEKAQKKAGKQSSTN